MERATQLEEQSELLSESSFPSSNFPNMDTPDSRYSLPNNEIDKERLDLQHELLYVAPFLATRLRIFREFVQQKRL